MPEYHEPLATMLVKEHLSSPAALPEETPDEGEHAAAEEMMEAFHARDTHGFLRSLKSFLAMCR